MATDYRRLARVDARRQGINPVLFSRQINQESGFNPNAHSPAGADGIAQFIPSTAKGMGVNTKDPRSSLDGAARLMAGYLQKYGNWKDALTAYNAGPGRVGGKLPTETQNYIKSILGGGNRAGTGSESTTSTRTVTTKAAVDNSGARRAALLDYMLHRESHDTQGGALLSTVGAIAKLKDSPARTKTVTSTSDAAPSTSTHGGVGKFDGKPVANWIVPILKEARKAGWKGTVSSGFRTDAEQTQIYDSGVRPAAKPKSEGGAGSNHEGTVYPLGAIDVTNAQQLAAIVQRLGLAKKLVYAGGKDPVHFSHPHGGGY